MLGFIINPASGNGKGAVVWKRVQEELQKRGIPFVSATTGAVGETIPLATQLLSNPDIETLVAIGGDGTVHEAVNALYQSGKTSTVAFGFIPSGTGNDFARGHGIPIIAKEALEVIVDKRSGRRIDLFEAGGKIAVNCLGIGFDALVAKQTNEAAYKKTLNKWKLGKVSYLIAAIKAFITFQPFSAKIEIGGGEQRYRNVWMIVSSNIPYFGGGMKVCPHAKCDDGIADITLFASGSRLQLVSIFISIYTGKHMQHPAVTIFKGDRLRITTDRQLEMQADGESLHLPELDINVLPQEMFIYMPMSDD